MEALKQLAFGEYCLKCFGCCRFADKQSQWVPHLLEEEKKKIVPFSKELQLLWDKKQGNFRCQFITDDTNKCKIYSIRPFECRLYPFLINQEGKKVFIAVDFKCPFLKKIAMEQYRQYVQYLTEFFGRPANINALVKNPQLIQSYEGVLNIFEIKL